MSMRDLPNLVAHLANNQTSSTLALPYASLSQAGLEKVSRFVESNSHIKTLDLRGNLFQLRSTAEIASAIEGNHSLKSLLLRGNAIGKDPMGIALLCTALKANLGIKHIDLRNNGINSVGAKNLGEMLMFNNTITHLDLSWNELGVDGGHAILCGLRHNVALVDCQLNGSKVDKGTVQEIALLLHRNKAAAAYKAPTTSSELTMCGAQVVNTTPVASPFSPLNKTSLLKAKPREFPAFDDNQLFNNIHSHVQKLQAQSHHYIENAKNSEARKEFVTSNHIERERRHENEIRQQEDKYQVALAMKDALEQEVANKESHLRIVSDGHARAVRDKEVTQQCAQVEEDQLRKQLHDVTQTRINLEEALAYHKTNLEKLKQENQRLRTDIKISLF